LIDIVSDVVESSEETHSQQDSEAKTESDSEKPEQPKPVVTQKPESPAIAAKPVVETCQTSGSSNAVMVVSDSDMVVSDSVRTVPLCQPPVSASVVSATVKSKSASSLEELENLHGLGG